MRAYSMDLRERVVAACDAGDATREQIAARFSVSVSWIRDLMRRRRETGSIAPKPRGGARGAAPGGDPGRRRRHARGAGRGGRRLLRPLGRAPGAESLSHKGCG